MIWFGLFGKFIDLYPSQSGLSCETVGIWTVSADYDFDSHDWEITANCPLLGVLLKFKGNTERDHLQTVRIPLAECKKIEREIAEVTKSHAQEIQSFVLPMLLGELVTQARSSNHNSAAAAANLRDLRVHTVGRYGER